MSSVLKTQNPGAMEFLQSPAEEAGVTVTRDPHFRAEPRDRADGSGIQRNRGQSAGVCGQPRVRPWSRAWLPEQTHEGGPLARNPSVTWSPCVDDAGSGVKGGLKHQAGV